MTVAVEELPRAAHHAQTAFRLIAGGIALAEAGKPDARDVLRNAREAARRTVGALQSAGVTPLGSPNRPVEEPEEGFDLADLAALEIVKPDLGELRLLLGKALSVAERIDEARGRSYPEPVGGSCGFDLAEDVNQLLARVELEIEGPNQKARE